MKTVYIESALRHRMLSDEKILFAACKANGTIHDKKCSILREIPDHQIIWLQEYECKRNQCRKCAMHTYIRIGAKDMDAYRKYEQFYTDAYIPLKFLRLMYVDRKMKTKIELNSLKVWYEEDAWLITLLDDSGHVQLKHNNYRRSEDGSRIFVPGFHIQNEKCKSCKFSYAINVISGYSYKDHFVMDTAMEKQSGKDERKLNENFIENEEAEERCNVCFLQALFGQSCKIFLDKVACPNWTKLQAPGQLVSSQPSGIADIMIITAQGVRMEDPDPVPRVRVP